MEENITPTGTEFNNQQTPPPIQNNPQQFNNQFGQIPVPNSTGVLVLGILSIIGCFCYLIPGFVMGIIALVLATKGNNIYKINPNSFTVASYTNLKAGKICAIIGVCLSSIALLFAIIYFIIVGSVLLSMPWQQMIK